MCESEAGSSDELLQAEQPLNSSHDDYLLYALKVTRICGLFLFLLTPAEECTPVQLMSYLLSRSLSLSLSLSRSLSRSLDVSDTEVGLLEADTQIMQQS